MNLSPESESLADNSTFSVTIWRPLAVGFSQVEDYTLFNLDNAVLPGGNYTLRLDATDRAGRLSQAFTEVVAGDIPKITSITPSPACPGEMITVTGFAFGPTQGTSTLQADGSTYSYGDAISLSGGLTVGSEALGQHRRSSSNSRRDCNDNLD